MIEPILKQFQIQLSEEMNCLGQNLRDERSLDQNLRENGANTYERCTQDSSNAKRDCGARECKACLPYKLDLPWYILHT
jgi:hypothetical protein